jgi:hypothetical protein
MGPITFTKGYSMFTIKTLVANVLMFSLIITPLMRADDKKESFWDKPANRALVITGAAACAVAIAMIAYSYNKKDVPSVAGSNKPAVNVTGNADDEEVPEKLASVIVDDNDSSEQQVHAAEYIKAYKRNLKLDLLARVDCDSESDTDADQIRDMPGYMHEILDSSFEAEKDQAIVAEFLADLDENAEVS